MSTPIKRRSEASLHNMSSEKKKKLRPSQEAATAHGGRKAASSEPSCSPLKRSCSQIKKERIAEATAELEGLRAQTFGFPVTRSEWAVWLHENFGNLGSS